MARDLVLIILEVKLIVIRQLKTRHGEAGKTNKQNKHLFRFIQRLMHKNVCFKKQ